MRSRIALIALALACASLGGCAAPRFCPPGTHPGLDGQRCILN